MKILPALALALLSFRSQAATEVKEPPAPRIPARTFDITKFGAVGDGATLNTDAFAKAIAACEKAGGGNVIVPPGVFVTAPFQLTSHMALVVQKGATIRASDKFSDFGLPDPLPATQEELSKIKPTPLITGSKLTDVAIRGEGIIDGAGASWWAKSDRAARTSGETFVSRPNLIVIQRSERVQFAGVTLQNSPQFHLVPKLCTDVLIDGVKILAPPDSPNTDAIDPSNCNNVLIRHVLTDSGDDNVAFKANHDGPCENITVTDCTFLHGHGVSLGSETVGGMRNILVQRCTFENTGTAIRIKSSRSRGGVVDDVTYRDITMKNVDAAIYINLYYDDKSQAKNPQPKPVTGETPFVRNVLISNVTCENAKSAGEITALPEAPATNIVLEKIRVSAWNGFTIQDAKGLQFRDVSIITSPKPPEAQPDASPAAKPAGGKSASAKPHKKIAANNGRVVVAADGSGDCENVQDAVNAAPENANTPKSATPFLIHIKPGTYKEVVTIPRGKAAMKFEGEDAAATTITFANGASTPDANGNQLGTFNSATVFVDSDDFSAENLTFENSFGKGSQALAISVGGDRASFRHCRFNGWQDTVLLRQGTQYFENCTITGAVDFIFGAASAWFEKCEIHCAGGGYITAASTPQEHAAGFVFSNCKITADSGVKTYLGRPWRPYASVAFLNTQISGEVIRPEGWENWRNPENEKTARFAEYKTSGVATDARVTWAKQLTDEQARDITPEKVLGGWNPVK